MDTLIESILTTRGGLTKPDVARVLALPETATLFQRALTHPSASATDNYEFLEFYGDSIVNLAIVTHLVQRFPEHQTPAGVKIFARLKINLVSRKSLAGLSLDLGLHAHVRVGKGSRFKVAKGTANVTTLNLQTMRILEDVFEALFGAIVIVIDKAFVPGVGNAVATKIIDSLLEPVNLSIRREDLFDAKTRLKELFDSFPHIGKCASQSTSTNGRVLVDILLHRPANPTEFWKSTDAPYLVLGHGSALLKVDAEMEASSIAIATLETMGVRCG